MVRPNRRLRSSAGRGYNLVALMVILAVMGIVLAGAVLPTWSHTMQRENEAELIFRGLQYAEAIRVFQLRFGRYPTQLRELIEAEPRCIRQLWVDPFSDDGRWGLVLAQGGAPGGQQLAAGQAPGRQPGQPPPSSLPSDGRRDSFSDRQAPPVPTERVQDPGGRHRGLPQAGDVVATGPIIGVRSLSEEEGLREFMGAKKYSEWIFSADLVPRLVQTALGENVPRLNSEWIGRPLPEGVDTPEGGGLPGAEGSNPLDRDRNRRGGNRRRRVNS